MCPNSWTLTRHRINAVCLLEPSFSNRPVTISSSLAIPTLQLATLGSKRSLGDVTSKIRIGDILTYNNHIGLDASFLAFLKKYSFVDFQQGGGIIQGLDGIKLRWRQNRLGVFCKARPAFNDTSEQFK